MNCERMCARSSSRVVKLFVALVFVVVIVSMFYRSAENNSRSQQDKSALQNFIVRVKQFALEARTIHNVSLHWLVYGCDDGSCEPTGYPTPVSFVTMFRGLGRWLLGLRNDEDMMTDKQ